LKDARIEKMREARLKQNSTGFPGVRAFRGLWHARVMVNSQRLSSRGFETKEQAAAWREGQLSARGLVTA
jgi:hypothetical protein